MAKDDYFVIVYQILAYLYQRLKKGENVNPVMLSHDSPLFKVNERYWAYILHHLSESGLIEGVIFLNLDGMNTPLPVKMDECQITPEGIAYLHDNSSMAKAKAFLKEVKDVITPFF